MHSIQRIPFQAGILANLLSNGAQVSQCILVYPDLADTFLVTTTFACFLGVCHINLILSSKQGNPALSTPATGSV
jgi:hypothetical protein